MNSLKQTLQFLCFFLALSESSCFAPQSTNHAQSKTADANSNNNIKTAPVVASLLTAAFLFSSVAFAPAPAFADTMDFHNNAMDSSSQVLAGRSGGRMGGRSSMGSRGGGGMRGGSYGGGGGAAYRSSTTVIRPTVIRPMVSPGVIYQRPMFSPFGGFGLGYGLGGGFGGGGFGGGYRDYRQDEELSRERSELESARARSAELESRIAQLEGRQAVAAPQQQLQLQQAPVQQQQQLQVAP